MIGGAHHPRIVNNLNNFNTLYTLPRGCHRPILISNASNMNAGLHLTVSLGHRSAVNVSLITVYIGSLIIRNTRPLFFLSCCTAKGLSISATSTIVDNVTRKYLRSNYSLINNRATRVPKVCRNRSCSITNFYINIMRGSRVVSNSGIDSNSILVTLNSDNPRSGNCSLIHGVLRIDNYSPRAARLSNGPLTSRLLTPAHVCIGSILRLVRGISIRTVTRLANNNF